MAAQVEGENGGALANRLWKEMMSEFAFANVEHILRAQEAYNRDIPNFSRLCEETHGPEKTLSLCFHELRRR